MRGYTRQNYGFTEEDSKDFYQDLMALIFEKVRKPEFEITCTFKTYFYAVANLILKNMNRRKIVRANHRVEDLKFDPFDFQEASKEEVLIEDYRELKRSDLFRVSFRSLPEDCRKLLRMTFKKMSLEEIGRRLHFSGEKYVKKRKFMCLQYLKQKIKNDPTYLNYIYHDDNRPN